MADFDESEDYGVGFLFKAMRKLSSSSGCFVLGDINKRPGLGVTVSKFQWLLWGSCTTTQLDFMGVFPFLNEKETDLDLVPSVQ